MDGPVSKKVPVFLKRPQKFENISLLVLTLVSIRQSQNQAGIFSNLGVFSQYPNFTAVNLIEANPSVLFICVFKDSYRNGRNTPHCFSKI